MERLDSDLETLHARRDAWASLPVATKREHLIAVRQALGVHARNWAQTAAAAKGLETTPWAGEEWITGPWATLYAVNRYIETLERIAAGRKPALALRAIRRRDGRTVARVFPRTLYDRLIFSGVDAEVWFESGVAPEDVDRFSATWYRGENAGGRVALVLGAGNIASIPPLDVLYKMYVDGCVCVLKMNPVNDYLGPILERIFESLIAAGFLRVAYGGADAGEYLCRHPLVDEIHITGSDRTHDAIVFGSGESAQARKLAGEPLIEKPITSELGNVSPTIVLPGDWSAADYRFQAANVATQKLLNGGFNCISSQVLVLPQGWDGTPAFLERLATTIAALPNRPSYYPGARDRFEAMRASGETTIFGGEEPNDVPRALVRVDYRRPSAAFEREAFCSTIAVVEIPGEPAAYLRDATAFANDRLRGTLGANLIVHPSTERAMRHEIDRAIADLHYGCVAINAWTALGYCLSEVPWGAFPGHTLHDVGSGIGRVHNSFFFTRTEKSVVRAPFAPFPRSFANGEWTLLPKPPWFVTNRNQLRIAERLFAFELHRRPLDALAVAVEALRG